MKLKLESLESGNEVTTLSVSEHIAAEHVPVLKAGINKLLHSDKKTLVLDLSDVDSESFQAPELPTLLTGIKQSAVELGATLVVISQVPGVGDFAKREDAIRHLNSPFGRLLLLESKLREQIELAKKHKASLEQQLESAQSSIGELQRLQNENGKIRKKITFLESSLKSRMKNRAEPFESATMKAKREAVEQALVFALEQQAVLPIGGAS